VEKVITGDLEFIEGEMVATGAGGTTAPPVS
jgi:hypothetical protein